MPNLSTVTHDSLYYMFKGEPGTRKSTQALSFAELGRQYWFSWDRKMAGLIIPMKKWGIDPTLVDYDDYEDWNKARAKLESLQVNCPYKSIVIDSLTSMADMTLRQTLKLKLGVTRASGASAGKLIAGIAVNEIEDYNAESGALNELMALTKDIKIFHKTNVILIAHVVQREQKVDGKTHISRQIVTAGKAVAQKIPAYCDEVYHFNIKGGFEVGVNGEYAMLTEHTGGDFARTTLPLDKEIVFNDRPLYRDFIQPAIIKLAETPSLQVIKF